MNNYIKLVGLTDECFTDYKKPSMYLAFPKCSFKCGSQVCQNFNLASAPSIEVPITSLCERYLNNPITSAIVCGGLEPFDSYNELYELIKILRISYNCYDDIIIYTGYNLQEISSLLIKLKEYVNIIIKYGRYINNSTSYYNSLLGVTLASNNQQAIRIEDIE